MIFGEIIVVAIPHETNVYCSENLELISQDTNILYAIKIAIFIEDSVTVACII